MRRPTEQELLDAACLHLFDQRSTLWGQYYNLHEESDRRAATHWLAEQVGHVLNTVRRNRKEN